MPFPSPGDLPNPGIEPRSPALQADALTSEPPGKPGSLWFLFIVEVGRVACQGFLVRKACVSVLVGGAGFLLSVVQ